MPQHLEPTYLRYIYDGLIKGSIHPENSADLPDGLIGLYEEAFDERNSVVERQKLLRRFAIWALLKKEVSAAFIADVLGEPEDDIQDFIATHSAWFNSPESGKYQLYHERLKVYLLQKLNEGEVSMLNGVIINYLRFKANEKEVTESSRYSYEHLSFHLFLHSHLTGEPDLLAQFCLDDSFKTRQFEVSSFYDWEEKMMVYGVEYFSVKENPICHQIVFEKTKIQYKKKDIALILDYVRNDKMDVVFLFFKSLNEKELEDRIALAYFYILTFFEIFELPEKIFVQKKELAFQLLEIFEEYFQWDKGYYLAQFIDVNLSFRLHCYFVQYGLDFKKYAILSSEHKSEFYGLEIRSDELKFIDPFHKEEAIYILKQHKIFYYGFKRDPDQILNLVDELSENFITGHGLKMSFSLDERLTDILLKIGRTKLLKGDHLIEIVENEIHSFNELVATIKFILERNELSQNISRDLYFSVNNTYLTESNGQIEITGYLHRNDLKIQKRKILSLNDERTAEFYNLEISHFENFQSREKYNILKSIVINEQNEVELKLILLDLSEYYNSLKTKDLFDVFSSLIIEYFLEKDSVKIELIQNQLISILVNSDYDNIPSGLILQDWHNWEDKIFEEIIIFFRLCQFQDKLKKFLQEKKNDIFLFYLNISYYEYSFKYGVELINLFNYYEIDFEEEEIVDRILDDLINLIEENDYNEMCEIESSFIHGIHSKPYFEKFFDTIKSIQIEQVKNNLSEYIFEDILHTKGINHNTQLFFKENSHKFPGFYLRAIKRISIKFAESSPILTYLPIVKHNVFLLESLLLNIVSSREKLKDPLNVHILNYYGLEWVLELDNEYEKLISAN